MKIAFGAQPIKLQKRQSIVFYDTLAFFSGQLVFHVLLIARILQCFSTKKPEVDGFFCRFACIFTTVLAGFLESAVFSR